MSDEKRLLKDSYPSNSNKSKEETKKEEPTKKVEKVIKGKVKKQKKSFGKKMMETFIGDDIPDVGAYILHDVLVPAAKNLAVEIVEGIKVNIEIALFGEKRSRSYRDKSRTYVSYDKYGKDDRRDGRRDMSSRDRATHNFDDIILESRGEAEEVLDRLIDLIQDYGQASVSDLYDLVGITGTFADNKYGWTDLRSATTTRGREGYVLKLPKPRVID